MKELTLEQSLSEFTVQEYYKVIYGDATAFSRFHKELTKDANAEVSQWQDGVRTVKFRMALNVPQMLKKLIGTDAITVVETQRLSWSAAKDKFTVISEPALDFVGANKFTTKGEITVSAGPAGTCQVMCVMTCNAAMPWPMQSTVEAAMASEAQSSVGNFMAFCKTLCDEARSMRGRPVPPSPLPRASVYVEEDGEQFFDAFESEEAGAEVYNNVAGAGASSGALLLRRPSASGAARALMPVAGRPEEALLVAVQTLQASSADTARAVEHMSEQLRLMNDNIAAIRAVVAPQRNGGSSSVPSLQGPAGPGLAYSPPLLMLLGLACGSAATVVLMKSAQRGGGGSGGAWW